ncbi:MAG: fibrobacter succinogenes major paralogous domain-containing protein, partial [Bacteroidota bacterium]
TDQTIYPPTLTTSPVTSITESSAVSGGNITDDGGAEVTARGVCWSTSESPDVTDDHTTDGTGTGSFTSSITGLDPNTTYYVKAYATNEQGTSYGGQVSFITGQTLALPSVTTTTITSITETSAEGGGNVTDEGGSLVIARGICWSTSHNPNLTDNYTTDGNGMGVFSSSISGLTANTTYHVRAYATNGEGTAFGEEVGFTTNSSVLKPTLTTATATSITENSAVSGGNITDDGGSAIIARGVCWSTSSAPDLTDNYTFDGSESGSFTSSITGLDPNTTYYIRAYATNSKGIAFGEELDFTTMEAPTGTLTDIDGNVYPVVLIGTQIWMAENLKVTSYADGTKIPFVVGETEWANLGVSGKAYCWYLNSTYNKDEYGGLYTWAAVMNGQISSDDNPSGVQGVCPDGWHLPSDSEWKQLEIYLGMNSIDADVTGFRGTDQGGKLKETGDVHWEPPDNLGATNESGFTALPGGYRGPDGLYYLIGFYGWFRTSTLYRYDETQAWVRRLWRKSEQIDRKTDLNNEGQSVRCLKD